MEKKKEEKQKSTEEKIFRVFPSDLAVMRTIGDIKAKKKEFGGNPMIIQLKLSVVCFSKADFMTISQASWLNSCISKFFSLALFLKTIQAALIISSLLKSSNIPSHPNTKKSSLLFISNINTSGVFIIVPGFPPNSFFFALISPIYLIYLRGFYVF